MLATPDATTAAPTTPPEARGTSKARYPARRCCSRQVQTLTPYHGNDLTASRSQRVRLGIVQPTRSLLERGVGPRANSSISLSTADGPDFGNARSVSKVPDTCHCRQVVRSGSEAGIPPFPLPHSPDGEDVSLLPSCATSPPSRKADVGGSSRHVRYGSRVDGALARTF